jgi:hypothetical protein
MALLVAALIARREQTAYALRQALGRAGWDPVSVTVQAVGPQGLDLRELRLAAPLGACVTAPDAPALRLGLPEAGGLHHDASLRIQTPRLRLQPGAAIDASEPLERVRVQGSPLNPAPRLSPSGSGALRTELHLEPLAETRIAGAPS